MFAIPFVDVAPSMILRDFPGSISPGKTAIVDRALPIFFVRKGKIITQIATGRVRIRTGLNIYGSRSSIA